MTVTKQLISPLLIALGILVSLRFLASPFGEAVNAMTLQPEQAPASAPAAQIGTQAIVLPGPDFKIAFGTNARSPEIAANNEFAALVYIQNNQVWLRSAQKGSGWGLNTRLALDGDLPKLAFRTGSTNTLYIVWEEATTIRFRRCTLADPVNTCSNPVAIASAPTSPGRLRTPDIAVGGSQIFVAWVDRQNTGSSADNLIRLARSTNNGQNWTVRPQGIALSGGDSAGLPSLAASTTHVHLAYKDVSSAWTAEYRRIPANLGAEDATENFAIGSSINGNYEVINNPAIALNGANVYLLWDNKHNIANLYGLTGVRNTNSGNNLNWGTVVHLTSQSNAATTDNAADHKRSKDSGPPNEEAALLPSVTRSGASFAAVWQQRPQDLCQDVGGNPLNDTSEIYFAPNVNSAAGSGTLADSSADYSLDPDVAIDTNGTHVAFMKDSSVPNCGTGGEIDEYGIFYRGPFTEESDKLKRILFPFVNVD